MLAVPDREGMSLPTSVSLCLSNGATAILGVLVALSINRIDFVHVILLLTGLFAAALLLAGFITEVLMLLAGMILVRTS